jgi:hypothetical protein
MTTFYLLKKWAFQMHKNSTLYLLCRQSFTCLSACSPSSKCKIHNSFKCMFSLLLNIYAIIKSQKKFIRLYFETLSSQLWWVMSAISNVGGDRRIEVSGQVGQKWDQISKTSQPQRHLPLYHSYSTGRSRKEDCGSRLALTKSGNPIWTTN